MCKVLRHSMNAYLYPMGGGAQYMHLGIYKKWLGLFVSGTVARDEDEQYACVFFGGGGGGLNAIPSPITLNLLST